MKNKIIYFLVAILVLGSIGFYIYYLNTQSSAPKIEIIKAAEQQITGGTWSTTCSGNVDFVHDGNTGTGVTCANGQQINWDFGGTYGNVSKVRIYSSSGGQDSNCFYPYSGVGFNCLGLGLPDWQYTTATEGPLDIGWNTRNLTALNDYSKFKFAAGDFGNVLIEEIEVYYTGSPPGPSPTPTPTPTPTYTPGPTSTPTPTMTGGPPPIDCPNPPCIEDPDDPIFPPTDDFNIKVEVPNGGEKWQIDKSYTVKWKSTDTENRIKSIALLLSKDGGENYDILIEQNLLNDGDYEWKIPDDESYITDEAKVLAAAYGDSLDRPLLNDKSDENFSIRGKDYISSVIKKDPLPWQIIALLFLLLAGGGVFWPFLLNSLLNSSFLTSILDKLFLGIPLGYNRNQPKVGVVFDASTKRPIKNAVVRLFDYGGKLKETTLTNNRGEFNFMIPAGKFYLKVYTHNYSFPSKNYLKTYKPALYQRREDNPNMFGMYVPGLSDRFYQNLYFGEIINNKGGVLQKNQPQNNQATGKSLDISIPLDSEGSYNIDELILRKLKKIEVVLMIIRWPLLILGIALSVLAMLISPSIFNLIILELYLVILFLDIFNRSKERPYGLTLDKQENPLDLCIVRTKGYTTGKIKSTAISNQKGKFILNINPGWYTFTATKGGYERDQRFIKLESARKLGKLNFKLKKYSPEANKK